MEPETTECSKSEPLIQCPAGQQLCLITGQCVPIKCDKASEEEPVTCPAGTQYCADTEKCVPIQCEGESGPGGCPVGMPYCPSTGRCESNCTYIPQLDTCQIYNNTFNYSTCLLHQHCSPHHQCCPNSKYRHNSLNNSMSFTIFYSGIFHLWPLLKPRIPL